MFSMLKHPWRTLRVRIIAWSFVPTTLILLAVALVTFYAYQKVAEDLVVGRNQELTRLSAGQLATDMGEYTGLLTTMTRNADIASGDVVSQRIALMNARNRLVVFDAGVVILDGRGRLVAAEPDRPWLLGQDWSNRDYFRQMLRSGGPVFSSIVPDGPEQSEVVVVAVPIVGSQSEFRGTMAGMFRLGATSVSAFYGGIVKLRIAEGGNTYLVDTNGRVIYHTDPDMVGRDLSGEETVRRALAVKAGQPRTVPLASNDLVASFAPVPGTPWVLVTEESWASLMSSGQVYQRWLLVLLALGVVVPALVVTVGVRRITGPVSQLIQAAQEVAAGNFGRTIEVNTGDELEELAKQFNTMSGELKDSYSDLERKVADRTKELAALAAENARLLAGQQRRAEQLQLINEVGRRITSILDLDGLLSEVVRLVKEALGHRMVAIGLVEEDELVFRSEAGSWPEVAGMQPLRLRVGQKGICGWVAKHGEPLLIPDVSQDSRYYRRLPTVPARSELAVPLKTKDTVIGVLDVQSDQVNDLDEDDLTLLQALAYQAAIAIENARLYEQARKLAVMEERNRLARDLHDSVTQAVYSVTLYAEAATRLLSAGQTEMAADHLRELRSTSQQALREMRSLIFELRPPVLEKEGLVAALQARLESVEARAGIQAELKVEGELQLPPESEEKLYRIAQEALNNALKHAQPRHVSLRIHQSDHHLQLEIVDDGVGFDLGAAREGGGLGLRGIEERACQMGGTLEVESSPGRGTTIKVTVRLPAGPEGVEGIQKDSQQSGEGG